jgi:hypothetical protein
VEFRDSRIQEVEEEGGCASSLVFEIKEAPLPFFLDFVNS